VQTTHFGSTIEAQVCTFLEINGLRCVQRNYTCRLGEIDLVMLDQADHSLVFVEVRFRARAQFGSATETVDWAKQRKLKRAVLHYLQKHADAKQVARIDVIGVCHLNVGESEGGGAIDDSIANSIKQEPAFGVSTHQYENYLLRWTRNAIED